MTGLAPALALLGASLALPAAMSSRRGPWSVRFAGVAVLLAVWIAVLDRTERSDQTLAPDVTLVATGAADGPGVDAIRGKVAAVPDARLTVAAVEGRSPTTALVAAALQGGAVHEIVLLWNGPFEAAAPPRGAPLFPDARSLSTAPVPAVEPGALELRAFGSLIAGRPAACELRLAFAERERWPADARIAVTVRDPAGAAVVERGLAPSDVQHGPLTFDWIPERAGEYAVAVEMRAADTVVTARGQLVVGDDRPAALVVGPPSPAETVRRALAAQGVTTSVAVTLPASIPPATVVVALGPLPAAEQERLLRFVEDGGGAFLVGADGGGALPAEGEPLAVASPLRRLPGAAAGPGPGADEPADAEAADRQPTAEPPSPAPPTAEQPAGDRPPESPDDRPITGDTAAAQQAPQVQEAEVERRQIALVLVIDRSASMSELAGGGAASKMDFAKVSAYETALQLEPDDELGIVAFGERAYGVRPLGPRPTTAELKADIEKLRAVDRNTLVASSLELAGQWLTQSTAPVRHAVVVTDGEEFDPGDARRAQSAARKMGVAGVTVSVVQIASTQVGRVLDVSEIARFGKGSFVRETSGAAIPRLVFAEVSRALGAVGRRPAGDQPAAQPGTGPTPEVPSPEAAPQVAEVPPQTDEPSPPAIEPEPATERPAGPASERRLRVVALEDSRLLEPTPTDGAFPVLAGICDVAAQGGARVLLAVEDGTPLLGFQNRGLGRVAAWSSDLTGGWSRAWREDDAFPGRLAAWVEAVRPPVEDVTAEDVLVERQIEPRGPLASERAVLAAFGLDALAPLASFVAPVPRTVTVERGRAGDDALFAVLAIVFLAFVEWLARRRGA